MRVFVFALIILGCVSCSHPQKKNPNSINVKEFLASLSSDERFLLEHFFRSIIQEDVIGYTLLGGKPMSIYTYIKPKTNVYLQQCNPVELVDLFFDGFDENFAIFNQGWAVWNKYQHLFCGRNIFFDCFEVEGERYYEVVRVVNKRLMLSLLDQYSCQFSTLDPSKKDKEALFDAFLHDQNFKKKAYWRDDLLGICLGYGAKNAALFQKMSKLLTSLGWMGFSPEKRSQERLKSLETEWTAFSKSTFNVGIQDHASDNFLFHLGIGFRADSSDPETSSLQEKYIKYHKELTLAYDGANFLEKTLELIQLADHS